MQETSEELDLLRAHRKFVLTTHISSDGDGVGSQLALARGLKSIGCEVSVINSTPVPQNLLFLLHGSDEILTPADAENLERYFSDALTVVLDMGAFERLGSVLDLARQNSAGILVIDHHRMEKVPGVHYLLDVEACATGAVTARILDALDIPITAEIAEPLYVAVHTDTGGFRYPGTTPETHNLVARLLRTGVDPQRVYTELHERLSLKRLQVTGAILSTVRISQGGKVAWIEVRRKMLDSLDACMEDADDMVNFTLQLDGVVAGFYFKELDRSLTKVSCRSRGNFAIDKFVSRWGGGGHQHAAGVRLKVGIDEAKTLILSEAARSLGEGAMKR
jgi:phosphoesterase RecJ-like protein